MLLVASIFQSAIMSTGLYVRFRQLLSQTYKSEGSEFARLYLGWLKIGWKIGKNAIHPGIF